MKVQWERKCTSYHLLFGFLEQLLVETCILQYPIHSRNTEISMIHIPKYVSHPSVKKFWPCWSKLSMGNLWQTFCFQNLIVNCFLLPISKNRSPFYLVDLLLLQESFILSRAASAMELYCSTLVVVASI